MISNVKTKGVWKQEEAVAYPVLPLSLPTMFI